MTTEAAGIALVGCGFVADYYLATIHRDPTLQVKGVFDRDASRSRLLSERYGVKAYAGLDQLLDDPAVKIVLNLTNPRSHFAISHAALKSGKHVYSEKPLAMTMTDAQTLVSTARENGLQIVSAPCSLLSETAQTAWRELRRGSIGTVRIAYAEMDDGPVYRMPYRKWLSASGLPWPWQDEFETGCTLEHAGYSLAWLLAYFGPASSVTAFASVQVPDKQLDIALSPHAPDFSMACIQHTDGTVSRLTCSIVAPHDHSMTICGDAGILEIKDTWDYYSPVKVRNWVSIRRRTFLSPLPRRIRLAASGRPKPKIGGAQVMDFARGVSEMSEAIGRGQQSCLSMDFSLHLTEVVLAIHESQARPGHREMTTSFQAISPMNWAA